MTLSTKLGAVIAVVHFAAETTAWATAPGNVAIASAAWPRWVWPALSFPLFAFLPARLANEWLYLLCIANSALWGLASAGLTRLVAARFGESEEHNVQ
jgi:hypothetical protein